jgi:hypothetical protein
MVYTQYTPYMGNVGPEGQTGSHTLEEALKLSQERVVKASQSQELGSGTPFLALDGAIGASLVSAGIFGGMATAFFVKSKGGKYTAFGMG